MRKLLRCNLFSIAMLFGFTLELRIYLTPPLLPPPPAVAPLQFPIQHQELIIGYNGSLFGNNNKYPRVIALSSLTESAHDLSQWNVSTAKADTSFWNSFPFRQSSTQRRTTDVLGTGICPYCLVESDSHLYEYERPYQDECTYMADWQTHFYPTCNTLHEVLDDDSVALLSMKGSWRSVWRVRGPENSTAVFKLLKFFREFNHESYMYHQIDAMAMEQLTSNPSIINAYGFCGQSVVTEYASGGARDFVKDPKVSSLQRLTMGRDLAWAFAAIHSTDYANSTNATLAHNDINLANAVVVNGKIKVNDLNLAILLKWNKTKPCGSPGNMQNATLHYLRIVIFFYQPLPVFFVFYAPVRFEAKLWKSPEENRNDSYVDPALADVYGLGNLLFQIMTKHQPWVRLFLPTSRCTVLYIDVIA
jgi:hypothetical protein